MKDPPQLYTFYISRKFPFPAPVTRIVDKWLNFGLRVLGVRVQDFGFRVSGLGFRVSSTECHEDRKEEEKLVPAPRRCRDCPRALPRLEFRVWRLGFMNWGGAVGFGV